MKKFALTLLSIAAAGALVLGCGAVTSPATASPTPTPVNTPTSSPTPVASPTPAATTIAAINHGTITAGSPVTLSGLVVTAVIASGAFYAQDAGGGPWAGILFFDKNHVAPALAIGDEVSVAGTFSPYNSPTSPWPIAENEVIPTSVTRTNSGLTPTAIEVTAANLATDLKVTSGTPADLSWMGALLHVTGLQVTSVGLGFGEYGVGSVATDVVHVDVGVYDSFEPRYVTESITSLTGVVSYDYKNYHVNPRSAADITSTGTNTPMNVTSISALLSSTTINPGQLVTLTTSPFVSGISPHTSGTKSSMSFWAQDSLAGAVNTGMYFYDRLYTNPTVAIGNQATITGKYVVGGSATFKVHSIEFGYSDLPSAAFSGTHTVTPMTVPLATLKSSTSSYEGVLVKVTDTGMTTQAAVNAYKEYRIGTTAVNTTHLLWISASAIDTSGAHGAAASPIVSAQGPVFFSFSNDFLVPQAMTDVQ